MSLKPLIYTLKEQKKKFSPAARFPLDPTFLSGPLKGPHTLLLSTDLNFLSGTLKRPLSY
jgi:hypothetical protein